ncbi:MULTISPECIES: NADH-quinone oxidoreductase subunit M [Helicobacter]|uniref:NADH-quinone oxidoreductase subunit M n=1 Tax=Helicobacter ibis TaxID=2962633 RepID=A0ABT4VCV4_9HELI|nr:MULTISPECIES: NADH-quinone oxidoreductase subunit M [Helicobacter]MDA3966697.1 NADH-quinone oxidoreductase subunit M [Helicobacter sp. WB40]MDA3968535.1 NADH-quinone oxidoreductase subunit M [Helicobacter ibis]
MEFILSLIIFFPLLGAIFAIGIKENLKTYAIVISGIELALTCLLWFLFDTQAYDYQFIASFPLVSDFGINYIVGVDGVSLFLVILSSFIAFVGFIYLNEQNETKKLIISLLCLLSIMIGVFCALDMILFYIFWELSLVPMLYIIGAWGSGSRIYAAVKFFLYTFVGSIIMLVGILYLAYYYFVETGIWSFSLIDWYNSVPIPFEIQIWLFLAFFCGLAVKVPMFPFHTWLPYAHGQAPTIGSIILAAVLLKMGTYGFVRFSLPLFPDASVYFLIPIAVLSLIMIIYGALVAFIQNDIKQVIAYSSISHMGVIMIGIFSLNVEGLSGSVFFMLSHGIISGALFMLVGMIYERKHTKQIDEFGGIAKVMPNYSAIFGLMMMASAGLPLTMGFVGEFLSLLGFFEVAPIMAGIAGISIIVGAIYMLNLYRKVFYGELDFKNAKLSDIDGREWTALLPLVIVVIWLGVYPKPILEPINKGIENTLSIMHYKSVKQETLDFFGIESELEGE